MAKIVVNTCNAHDDRRDFPPFSWISASVRTLEPPCSDLRSLEKVRSLYRVLQDLVFKQVFYKRTFSSDLKSEHGGSKVRTEALIHEKRGKSRRSSCALQVFTTIFAIPSPSVTKFKGSMRSSSRPDSFRAIFTTRCLSPHGDLVDAMELAVRKRKQLPEEFTVLIGEPKTLSYDALQRMISKLLYKREFTTFRIPKCVAKMGAWVQCHLHGDPFIRPWMIDYAMITTR